MRKIKLNFLLIFNFFIFSNITFSEENIYRIDYIIFKFLPDITSEERFLPPEIFFSDELINITNLKYPEFIKPDSLENNLPYQDLFQDISITRIIDNSNIQKKEKEEKIEMSKNQVFFQNDSGIDFAMEEIIQSLKKSKNYRVIGFNSWFQKIKKETEALPILVKTEADNKDIVIGELKAYKKRFLHLDLNLYFTKESSEPAPSEINIKILEQTKKDQFEMKESNLLEEVNLNFLYRMNHSRKVKSKELHYVDHPKFGVIFQIFPITNK